MSRVLRTRARRSASQLAGAAREDIVVEADAAGAANLMREIVALRNVRVALEEHDGRWQVVVRPGEDYDAVLAGVVELTARCVERGCMEHATLSVRERSSTIRREITADAPPVAA
jgi:hypothetical protein